MTDESDIEIPAELGMALRSGARPAPVITSRVDREIAARARAQFASRGEGSVARPRRRPIWFAAAATVLVAVGITLLRSPEQGTAPAFGDIDGSGQVDIADVMMLALQQRDGVSQADLDAFAAQIVSLADNRGHQ